MIFNKSPTLSQYNIQQLHQYSYSFFIYDILTLSTTGSSNPIKITICFAKIVFWLFTTVIVKKNDYIAMGVTPVVVEDILTEIHLKQSEMLILKTWLHNMSGSDTVHFMKKPQIWYTVKGMSPRLFFKPECNTHNRIRSRVLSFLHGSAHKAKGQKYLSVPLFLVKRFFFDT